MFRLLFSLCLEVFWCCLLLVIKLINYWDVVHNCGDFMVIILVILHVVENKASWCTSFGPILV